MDGLLLAADASTGSFDLSTAFTGVFSGFADQFQSAVSSGVIPIAAAVLGVTVGLPLIIHFGKKIFG